MKRVRLNDGTELNGTAMRDGDILWLDLKEISFGEASGYLLDPQLTEKITVLIDDDSVVYEGYTHLFYMQETNGVKISAGLDKAVNE